MKKRSSIILALLACAGLAACSSNSAGTQTTAAATTAAAAETTAAAGESKAEEAAAPATDVQWPTGTVTVVVPAAAGSTIDLQARIYTTYLQKSTGQAFVVTNDTTGNGTVAYENVKNAKPDGSTLLWTQNLFIQSRGGVYSEEPWDNFDVIANCGDTVEQYILVARAGEKYTNWEELVAYAKEHPGEVKLGTTGVNTVNYADTLRLMKALGIENDITVVPFDGGSAANTALLGNQIQLLTMSVSDTKSYVASGDFYGMVVFGEDRAKALPDTPCSKELGIDITTTKPRGYYAPAGTSQEVLDLLADAIEEVTKTEEFATLVEGYGWEINFVRGSEMQPKIEAWAEELAPVFQEILNAN